MPGIIATSAVRESSVMPYLSFLTRRYRNDVHHRYLSGSPSGSSNHVQRRNVPPSRFPATVHDRHRHNPPAHLKGNWPEEAGFDTGQGVTVRITQGCIVLMAESNEVQELREQLYQAKQVVKGIKDGMFSVLNEG